VKISIVIPTYNEAENLPKLAAELFALPMSNFDVLIVDDNSPDGTGQLAEELSGQYDHRIRVMHRAGKLGLGTAYIQGFQKCLAEGYDAIAQMDADFSHPIDKIPLMAEALKNADVVVGSRYVQGGSVDRDWPIWRKGLSAWGNFYARTILGLPMRDVTAGYRMWRRTTLEGMPLERIRSNGYVFQVEMSYVAHKLGYKFTEIPIYFIDRRWGKSKMDFRIQAEAALRTWQLLGMYRDLKKAEA